MGVRLSRICPCQSTSPEVHIKLTMVIHSDWFRREAKNDSFEPTVDMLLNTTFFVWFGIVCPWPLFASSIISLWRLVVLAIVILLLRRPVVLLMLQRPLWQIGGTKEAAFVGFFGPIGVSAIFYQHIALEFLRTEIQGPGGIIRGDVKVMVETVRITIWFIVLCSVVSPLHEMVFFFFSQLYGYLTNA